MSTSIDKMIMEIEDLISPGMSTDEEELALEKIEEVLKLDSKNTDALFWKAAICEMNRDYRGAMEIYEEILKITPDDKNIQECLQATKDCIAVLSDEKPSDTSFLNKERSFNFFERISIWQILVFKAVVIALILAYVFY